MISTRFSVFETDPARFEVNVARRTISYSTQGWVSTMALHFASRAELLRVLRRCIDAYAEATASTPGQAEQVMVEEKANAED